MPTYRLTHFGDQGPQLVRAFDITPEDDEAPRPHIGEKGLLVSRQPEAGAAKNRSGLQPITP